MPESQTQNFTVLMNRSRLQFFLLSASFYVILVSSMFSSVREDMWTGICSSHQVYASMAAAKHLVCQRLLRQGPWAIWPCRSSGVVAGPRWLFAFLKALIFLKDLTSQPLPAMRSKPSFSFQNQFPNNNLGHLSGQRQFTYLPWAKLFWDQQ